MFKTLIQKVRLARRNTLFKNFITKSSNINFSADDIFWKSASILLHAAGHDVFGFGDETSAFFVDQGVDVVFHCLVGVADLSDDEVQEYKGAEDYHDEPDNPKQILLCRSLSGLNKWCKMEIGN